MPNGKKSISKKNGFTLVELLVVLSIIALLLTIASPRYFRNIDRAKEATLKQDLNTIRDGIDKYYADKGKYPSDLEELVTLHYISKMPVDPITEKADTWIVIAPDATEEGQLYNLHSGATGVAEDGSRFSDW